MGTGEPHARVAAGAEGALVVGGDYQGLGIVRSLGRQGVPVYVVDDERSIARFSRFATRALRVPDLRNPSRAVESVLDIGRRHGLHGWVLYPTRDEIVAAFSQRREALAEVFRVPTPPWETVRTAWDKRSTYEMAEALGIPCPRTFSVSGIEELGALDLAFPIVVKPAIKEHFIHEAKVKALRADDQTHLEAIFRRVCEVIPPEEILLQELIPGGGERQFSYCAFFKEGAPVATMVARRTRQHPHDFGRSSTYVETVHLPELEEPSERFLREIDYYGLVEIEYKLDPSNGLYKLLDVNARTWGFHTVGRRAGVDFPLLLFRDQLGQPVEHLRAAQGVRWVRLTTDLPTGIGEVLHGRLGARGFLKSITHFETEAVFERGDLLPGLAEIALLPHLYRTRARRAWRAA